MRRRWEQSGNRKSRPEPEVLVGIGEVKGFPEDGCVVLICGGTIVDTEIL